jgi:hypothetical protein
MTRKTITKLLLSALLIGLYSNSLSASALNEKHGDCNFIFDNGDLRRQWNASMIYLRVSGVEEPDNQIFKNICTLCSQLSSKDIYMLPSTNDPNNPNIQIGTGKGLNHLKIRSSGCVFDYYYGIKGDMFRTDQNFRKACSSSLSSPPSSRSHSGVSYVKQSDVASGDLWFVGCNDRSYGNVSIINSSICASSADRPSKCQPQDRWTVGSAAEYLCH